MYELQARPQRTNPRNFFNRCRGRHSFPGADNLKFHKPSKTSTTSPPPTPSILTRSLSTPPTHRLWRPDYQYGAGHRYHFQYDQPRPPPLSPSDPPSPSNRPVVSKTAGGPSIANTTPDASRTPTSTMSARTFQHSQRPKKPRASARSTTRRCARACSPSRRA